MTISTGRTKVRRGWLALASTAVVSLTVSHWGCEVPPLMAPGSSITLIANPEFIVANGGVSVITALVVEPAGTLVPDGTVVFFFTNLGRIDPEGKTVDGRARVNLVADSRSGEAHIIAFSGGAAPNPSGGGTSGTNGTATINIGSALPTTLVVTANPPSLVAGGQSAITANVFDERGNPVANVPVIFTLGTQGPPAPGERMESGGAQRFTDTNGQAFDTLITRPPTSGRGNRTLQVQANVAGIDSPGIAPVLVTQ